MIYISLSLYIYIYIHNRITYSVIYESQPASSAITPDAKPAREVFPRARVGDAESCLGRQFAPYTCI